jgi:uncharacterized protein
MKHSLNLPGFNGLKLGSVHRAIRVLVMLVISLLLVLPGACPAFATGVYDFPLTIDASTWIVDEGEVLSRLTVGNISQSLKSLALKTGNEVRVVTLHRLDYGETAQTLGEKLFDQWFPTPEAKASQVLLVLDNVTNDSAIVAGEAAAALLTPEIAESVTQETLMAPLRQGNRYNQALADASDRIVTVLSGEPDPGPPVIEEVAQTEGTFATREETETKRSSYTVWLIGLLAAATIIPMATYYLYLFLQSRA